jgi:hypothetical protein
MSDRSQKKSPLEIADLTLLHNAGASMEMIGNVISQWGGLSDDLRSGSRESIDVEDEARSGHSQPGSLNVE